MLGILRAFTQDTAKKKHAVDLQELEIWEVSFLNQTGESLWNRGNLYKVCQQIKESQILQT